MPSKNSGVESLELSTGKPGIPSTIQSHIGNDRNNNRNLNSDKIQVSYSIRQQQEARKT